MALSLAATALSDGRGDGVEAVQHRVDAIDATPSSSSSFLTLSQYGLDDLGHLVDKRNGPGHVI